MAIKNPTSILLQAVKYPAAVEAKLPTGAPKLSEMMTDVATKLPEVPDLPMEIPDLPTVPALPEMPVMPGLRAPGLVRGVTVTPVGGRAPLPMAGAGGGSWEKTPVSAAGVVGRGHTVRDYA